MCFKLSNVFVSESNCTMVASGIAYSDDNRLADASIDINACKQKCLDTVECTAIIHYTGNACLSYSQYTIGSRQGGSSFIKSCLQKPCELFPIQLPISIILTVCTDNCHLAVSVSVFLSVSLCFYEYSGSFSLYISSSCV